jgi:nickel-dependent lactate racemase
MIIHLPWGESQLPLKLPATWKVQRPGPDRPERPRPGDETEIVQAALGQPAAAPPLRDRPLEGKSVLIVVDDNTRPTPVDRFLHLILVELEQAGVDLSQVLLMPALGIHTPMTDQEMAKKVGRENLARIGWRNHDAFDPDQMHDFGRTSRGTPVILNRAVAAADLVVLIGLIEPHLWAGFGGGLKNLLPGVAAAECIGRHHALIARPPYRVNRAGMAPEENDFRLDLEEARRLIAADVFCLNVSLDHTGRIIGAFAGDPVAAHRQGVHFNREISGRRLAGPVDGIVVNSHPMDLNFKQSMKGVGNILPALKPGGAVMGFLRAERGLDDIVLPADPKPLWLVKNLLRLLGPKRVMGFLEKVKPGLNVEEKFLMYYSMQLIRAYELYFYVPRLSDKEVKHLGFFERLAEPQAVIDRAARKLGRHAAVAVFPEAGATFPLMD